VYSFENFIFGELSSMTNQPFTLEPLLAVSGDDPDFMVEILTMFLDQVEIEVQRVKNLEEEKNWEEIRYTAHRLRSSAGSVGALKIASKCSELERYILAGNDIEKGVHLYVQNFIETCNTEVSEIKVAVASLLNGSKGTIG